MDLKFHMKNLIVTHCLLGSKITQERIIQFDYNNTEHQKLLISKLRRLGDCYHKYIAPSCK